MHRAFASAIGLPSRSTSASLMLAFLIPADVRRNLMLPPGAMVVGVLLTQTRQTPTNHRRHAGKTPSGSIDRARVACHRPPDDEARARRDRCGDRAVGGRRKLRAGN